MRGRKKSTAVQDGQEIVAQKYDLWCFAVWGWILLAAAVAGLVFAVLCFCGVLSFPEETRGLYVFAGVAVFCFGIIFGIVLLRRYRRLRSVPDELIVLRGDTFFVQTKEGEKKIPVCEVLDVRMLGADGVLMTGYNYGTDQPAFDHGRIRLCLKNGESAETFEVRHVAETSQRLKEIVAQQRK